MKKLFFLLFILATVSSFSQTMELIGGINQNRFFDYQSNDPHSSSSYQSDMSFTVRLAIEDIKVDWLTLRFTFGYDEYGGKAEASSGGLGAGSYKSFNIENQLFLLGYFR